MNFNRQFRDTSFRSRMVVKVPVLFALLPLIAAAFAACFDTPEAMRAPAFFLGAAQQQAEEHVQTKSEPDLFFSGNVLEMSPEHVVVSRTILGKPPEKRRFIVNASTKVEGRMKPKSRVTVRFAPSDDGDVALSVLVREEKAEKKKL